MKYVIVITLAFLFSACSESGGAGSVKQGEVAEAVPGPAPQAPPPEPTIPSVTGNWNIISSYGINGDKEPTGGKPNGIQLTFSGSTFTVSRFYNEYLKGSTRKFLYIIINLGGKYITHTDSIELLYSWPACAAGTRQIWQIESVHPSRHSISLILPNAIRSTRFNAGSIMSEIQSRDPVEITDCAYAAVDSTEKNRMPASKMDESIFKPLMIKPASEKLKNN